MMRGGLVGLLVFLGGCFGVSGYQGSSKHFDGEVFLNEIDTDQGGIDAFLRWRRTRDPSPWPEWRDATPGPAPPERVPVGDLRVTFVNHATMLIQVDGLNILTDPIWSERCSPLSWAGPKRIRPPGLRFEDLPPIDVVLISHNHYDHMDVPTLQQLGATHSPRIFVGLGNTDFLAGQEVPNTQDLEWGDEVELSPDVRLFALPARHFSGRGPFDRNTTLWLSYILQTPHGNIYFAGDTGMGPHFAAIGQRFGPLRVAILPIGAYSPRHFMAPVHIDPAEAVEAHLALRAKTSIGMHFGTFPLADEGPDDPPNDLLRALDALGLPRDEFQVLGFGAALDLPPLQDR